jgi:hypothetical protein
MKPCKEHGVYVKQFYSPLLELNNFVNWPSGIDDPLTWQQLKQSLYDAMLQTWKDSFVNSGMLFANQATAKTLPYFYQ